MSQKIDICAIIRFQQILRETVAARNRVDLLNRSQLSPRQEHELQRYIDGNAFVRGGDGGSPSTQQNYKTVSWYNAYGDSDRHRARSSSPPNRYISS